MLDIEIRPLREDDIEGALLVLKDAAYSHIWPGYLVTLRKSTFKLTSILLALIGLVISSGSVWVCLALVVLSFVSAFLVNFCAAVYYIHGPPLHDMKDPITEYRLVLIYIIICITSDSAIDLLLRLSID